MVVRQARYIKPCCAISPRELENLTSCFLPHGPRRDGVGECGGVGEQQGEEQGGLGGSVGGGEQE